MRKVLSFVLVLTLVLSSFSMAFAAETTATAAGLTDISASANSQAIEVANNLGIVTGNPDGTFQPEKAVNRAEFAAMITRALGIPQSALAGYTATSFKDTTGYGWAVPYLAFCQSKGIMLGDGAGNVMPGRTINTNEAATMIMRAIGYTSNSSALVGVWPANYVSLAQDKGIYSDVASAVSLDKQNAAQMIYNALSVQKVQVAADGTTTSLTEKNAAGTADIPVSMLTGGLNCEAQPAKVMTYDEDAVINSVPYVGDYATYYTNSDGDLIAVDDVKSTAITGTFNAANTTFTSEDDVDYSIAGAGVRIAGYEEMVNGDDTVANVAFGAYPTTKTYTINVKLSNKTVTEWYSTEEWTVSAAAKIVAGDLASIADGSFLGYDFATDKNDKIITKSFALAGVANLSDIKADSVVYVYEDATRDEISKVTVGTAVVEGKVTKVNAADKEWTVGGKVYAFGLDGSNGSKAYANELNNDVKLYLDQAGDIYKYDVTSGSAKDYAVVIGMDLAGTNDGNMKLYLADDSKKTFSSDFDEWTWVKGNVSTAATRIIGYGVDKDGVIDGVFPQTAADGAGAWVNGAANFKSNTVVTLAGADRVIDADVVVFTEVAATGEITGVAKIADVDKGVAVGAGTEALVRDGEIVALIVNEAFVSGSGDSQYAVVSAADSAVNPAGDKAQVLTGFIDGTKMAKDSVYTSGQSTVTLYNTAAVYKIKYNDDKNISKADRVYAGVTNTAIVANGYTSDNYIKTAGATHAIATNAKYYEIAFEVPGGQVTLDEYKIYNGTIYAGMNVWLYETDDDSDGYDIVIIDKNNIATYNDPVLSVAPSTYNVAAASSQGAVASIATASAVSGIPGAGYVYSISNIVAGTATLTATTGAFTINAATGVIAYAGGTALPTAAGTVVVTVKVADSLGNTDTEDLTVTIL